MEWISIEDEIPKQFEYVLFLTNHPEKKYKYFVGYLENENYYDGSSNIMFYGPPCYEIIFELENIIHWMPLPEPPKCTKK
jgi:hypothetical protein